MPEPTIASFPTATRVSDEVMRVKLRDGRVVYRGRDELEPARPPVTPAKSS